MLFCLGLSPDGEFPLPSYEATRGLHTLSPSSGQDGEGQGEVKIHSPLFPLSKTERSIKPYSALVGPAMGRNFRECLSPIPSSVGPGMAACSWSPGHDGDGEDFTTWWRIFGSPHGDRLTHRRVETRWPDSGSRSVLCYRQSTLSSGAPG